VPTRFLLLQARSHFHATYYFIQVLYNVSAINSDVFLLVGNSTNCLNLFHRIRIPYAAAISLYDGNRYMNRYAEIVWFAVIQICSGRLRALVERVAVVFVNVYISSDWWMTGCAPRIWILGILDCSDCPRSLGTPTRRIYSLSYTPGRLFVSRNVISLRLTVRMSICGNPADIYVCRWRYLLARSHSSTPCQERRLHGVITDWPRPPCRVIDPVCVSEYLPVSGQ